MNEAQALDKTLSSGANEPDTATSVSVQSISLEQANLSAVRANSEHALNSYYHSAVSELEKKYKNGLLRQEQFMRKRATLRVDYWTQMDRIRNNATPTVINA